MRSLLQPALLLLLVMTLLTGVAYPLLVTGAASLFFPRQAGGSLLHRGGTIRGSELIGQPFTAPGYFWPRPSASASFPYNAQGGAGSNRGPTNPVLVEAAKQQAVALRQADRHANELIPVDLLTASGSGLDPHISPAAARFQATRVARARGVAEPEIRRLLDQHIEGRTFGILGEPRVNVLRLNLSLDAAYPPPR